jgi:hypothetical protein
MASSALEKYKQLQAEMEALKNSPEVLHEIESTRKREQRERLQKKKINLYGPNYIPYLEELDKLRQVKAEVNRLRSTLTNYRVGKKPSSKGRGKK